jgi:Flp pilus assembly protein TadD
MLQLGFLASKFKGDSESAAKWYEKAAELGELDAIHNLGILAVRAGDNEKATGLFASAARQGHVRSMTMLASIMENAGEDDAAASWYQSAASHGNVNAMAKLGDLYSRTGDLDEAVKYWHEAASRNDTNSMCDLGYRFLNLGELDLAKDWFRKAIELGNVKAFVGLGQTFQHGGKMIDAEHWLLRAVEEDAPGGADSLELLRSKLVTDQDLDAITFTNFGWRMITNRDKFRRWRGGGATLVEQFIMMPPDFRTWDADEIRKDMIEFQGYVDSPEFDIGDLDLPVEMGNIDLSKMPDEQGLVDVECFLIEQTKCLLTISRHRLTGHVGFTAALLLLYRECFWMLTLETEEGSEIGEREGAVAREILQTSLSTEIQSLNFDPYERQWDGIVPVEDDPLTRLRFLARELRNSISFGDKAKHLEPYEP